MTSGRRLIENYEGREKDLNATLTACELQVGHLLLSGRTECSDEEYEKPYCLIAADISTINDKCREINTLEQRKNLLEGNLLEIKRTIQNLEPDKKSVFINLGKVLFESYTDKLSSTCGPLYNSMSEEKRYLTLLESKASDLEDQIEAGTVLSKIMLKMKLSSVRNQMASHSRKLEAMMAECAEKAYSAGLVDEDNGGMALNACTIVMENISLENGKLEKTQTELNEIAMKLKSSEKKNILLDEAAVKAGELDDLAILSGKKFSLTYISADAEKLQEFPPEFAAKLHDIFDIREELVSIGRRKEMLRCSEQLDSAASTIAAIEAEIESNKAYVEKILRRNEELAERMVQSLNATDSIKKRKVFLEMKEGITVSRLLGDYVPAEVAEARDAEKAAADAQAEKVIIMPAPEAVEAPVTEPSADVQESPAEETVPADVKTNPAEEKKAPAKRGRKPKAADAAGAEEPADGAPKEKKTSSRRKASSATEKAAGKTAASTRTKKEKVPEPETTAGGSPAEEAKPEPSAE